MDSLSDVFKIGRAGAGLNTTGNKISLEDGTYWGGQGAAFEKSSWGRIFVAVVLNPVGDVHINGKAMSGHANDSRLLRTQSKPGKNTTLSIVVTDLPLDRNQLQRMATMVHASMGESIRPFNSYHDGDILFAVSTATGKKTLDDPDLEFEATQKAVSLMKDAIKESVQTANKPLQERK